MSPRSRKKNSPVLRRGSGKYKDGSLRNMFVSAQDQTLGGAMGSPGNRSVPGNGHSKFTLLEEVRNTERRHNFWAKDSRLRHSPITFLSAGDYDASKEINTNLVNGQQDDKQLDRRNETPPVDNPEPAHTAPAAGEDKSANQEGVPNQSENIPAKLASRDPERKVDRALFVVDVKGSDAPIKTGFSSPKFPPPSPTLSHSSEDLIIFTGRNNKPSLQNEPKTSVDIRHSSATHAPEGVKGTSLHHKGEHERPHQSERSFSSGIKLIDDPPLISLDIVATEATVELKVSASEKANGRDGNKRSRNHAQRMAKRESKAKETEDAMLADYIANMREHGEDDVVDKQPYNKRDLGGEEIDIGDEDHATVPKTSASPDVTAKDDWASSDLQDFENLSTSDEVLGSIQHILAKRTRSNGLQYLIVWEGQTTDDARWTLSSSLTMSGAVEQIRVFEEKLKEKEKAFAAAALNDSTDSSDPDWEPDPLDESDQDSDDEEGRIKDNEDLLQRKIARMTDEKIARLLSKQEELGMGSDELLLFDDDDVEDDEDGYGADDNDVQAEDEKLPYSPTLNRTLPTYKRSRRGLAAASSMEPYGDFDIMDRDRPSLQKRAKGRGPPLPFELSDPELEANLRTTWEKDRTKKSIRKQEREELRAQGLLGKKSKDKAGPYNQYSNGIDIDKIKNDIKKLLLSTNETLSLPPMDKRNRKLVHELANTFNLKSKSMGHGRSRYPTLIKTKSTGSFNQSMFEAAEANLTRRAFLIRMDKPPNRKTNKQSSRGTFNHSAVSYRDGDIVGAAAPELGVENKGRAMLEKMGWSKGTALGALDNKGILHPVEHIVKTSKAGLG